MEREIRLGPFVADRPIARGGMGEVWRATHPPTGLPVAIKVMLGERALRGGAELERETRLLARLDHPHIATVLDTGVVPDDVADGRLAPGSPWLAIEWVGGGALYQRPRPGTWEGVLGLARPLLSALGHAHARGILHCDVKPANVLLLDQADGSTLRHPVLTDFGLAVLAEVDPSRQGAEGTPEFMPPEQWRGTAVAGSDLYAFGCLLYWLVSGRTPFVGSPRELRALHLLSPAPALRPDVPVPRDLQELLDRLLAKEIEDRPGSAAEVDAALAALDGDLVHGVSAGDGPGAFQSGLFGVTEALPGEEAAPAPLPARSRPALALPLGWTTPPHRRNPALDGAGLALWGLRPIPTVGRIAERDRLWNGLVQTAQDRRPRWYSVRGAPGTGKSHLLRWLAERAAETGAIRVLRSGRPVDDQPTLLILDDATPEELAAASLLDGPVVVVAVGHGEPPWAEILTLTALDDAQAIRLGRESLRLDRLTALRVAEASGGSPGITVAIVSAWLASGSLVAGPRGLEARSTELPDAVVAPYREAARAIVEDALAARVLDAIAATGGGPIARIAAIADVGEALALAVAGQVAETGDEVRIHGVGRLALELGSRARGTWTEANRRAAELARAEGRKVDLGRHAWAAGDPETAWRALAVSVPWEAHTIGFLRAWDLLAVAREARAACGADPHDDDGLQLLADTMMVGSNLGTSGEILPAVRIAIEAAARSGLRGREAALVHRLAEWQNRIGEQQEAQALWTRLARFGGTPSADAYAARATRDLGKLASQQGDHDRAVALGIDAVGRSESPTDRAKAAFELACSYEQAGRLEPARRWYAESAGTPGASDLERASALNGLAELLRREGDPDGAQAAYEEVMRIFDAHHASQVGVVAINIALCKLDRGEVHAAEHDAARGRDVALGGGQIIPQIAAAFILATTTALQSRWEEHAWHADQGLGLAAGIAYADLDFALLSERCARLARAAGLTRLAERWAAYAAESRRRLGS